MSEYSIYVENGKVVGDSTFFLLANALLEKECKRLCDFTDALDKDPAQKKACMAEYKCAKYRFAAVSFIHNTVIQHNRSLENHFDTMINHQLQQFNLFRLKIYVLFTICGKWNRKRDVEGRKKC